MTDVEVKQLTKAQARKATDKAKRDVSALRVEIANLYLAGADKALGYDSWEAYADKEFADLGLSLPRENRRIEVASLAEQGYPMRAIAAAVGANRMTVERDLGKHKSAVEDQAEWCDPIEDEIVDAEVVDETPAPPKNRRPRTDVVGTMSSVIRRTEAARELAAQINATHLKGRPEEAVQWHRLLTPAVTELTALLVLLEEAAE